jgi:hypothetical protein
MSAAGSRWDSEDAQFLREIMEAFADPEVSEIVIVCGAQSGKTLTVLGMLAWCIAEDPGPTLWLGASTPEAKKFSRTRLTPTLEKCEPTAAKIPSGRNQKTVQAIYFPGAPLIITGVTDTNALESTPYRYLLLDEVHKYKKGSLETVSKRARSYHNYKKVIISTGSDENDELHLAFKHGDQRQYEVQCPKCKEFHALDFGDRDSVGGFKWDSNTVTRPNGRWDWDELHKTIRYRCWNPDCGHEIKDNVSARKEFQARGRWKPRNLNAPKKVRSYQWGSQLPWWTSWADIVDEFLKASHALNFGNHELLKVFYTRTLGLWFADRHRYERDERFLDKRKVVYNPIVIWDEEERRFLTIDVQGKGGRHFWWLIRAWAKGGASRLIAFGKAWTIEEVRSKANEFHVGPQNIGIDSGKWTSEVYGYIMESGIMPNGHWAWKAMKGDKGDGYFIEGVKQPWNFTFVDPFLGRRNPEDGREAHPIRQLLFSKNAMLDRVELAMRGLDVEWLIPKEYSEQNPHGPKKEDLHEYMLQTTAYERQEEKDDRGVITHHWYQKRDEDHLGSCERMQMACAMAAGLLMPPPP